MLVLHGFPISNYTNMVRAALLEKGIEFEAVADAPSQDPGFLAISPMGKVPCLQTDHGYLVETPAILDYLEEIHPEPALLPADPFARAKARELAQALALYVDLTARKGIAVLFGREVPDHVKAGMRRDLPKGLAAIARLAKFSPWIAGESFTYADLVGYYAFQLAIRISAPTIDLDPLAEIPGAAAWHGRVGARESVRTADAEMAQALRARES